MDHAKIHRKTEHNQIRQGQNPVFTELYDVGEFTRYTVILWRVQAV